MSNMDIAVAVVTGVLGLLVGAGLAVFVIAWISKRGGPRF